MVYVTPDGRVLQTRPWSLGRVTDIFWGVIDFVTQFFSTMFGFERATLTGRSGRSGGSSGGGGGNGPGGPGTGPPRPPRRIVTMKEIQDCSMPGGG